MVLPVVTVTTAAFATEKIKSLCYNLQARDALQRNTTPYCSPRSKALKFFRPKYSKVLVVAKSLKVLLFHIQKREKGSGGLEEAYSFIALQLLARFLARMGDYHAHWAGAVASFFHRGSIRCPVIFTWS